MRLGDCSSGLNYQAVPRIYNMGWVDKPPFRYIVASAPRCRRSVSRKLDRAQARMVTAIDLFSGAGGISIGLLEAGYQVLFANDIDGPSSNTYNENHEGIPFHCGDIHELEASHIFKRTGLLKGELDLLIGGPPCQGFSIIGSRNKCDPRNDLFHQFLRLTRDLMPKCIAIENVPGLATLNGGQVLNAVAEGFRHAGYTFEFAELLAAQYGVPQMRWRMFFIGFRKDLDIPPKVGFPRPTHGKRGIGELVPNRTISSADAEGFLTAWDAIGDLPPVNPGEKVDNYTGCPTTEYQREMRKGLTNELANHYAPRLSEQNIRRIKALLPGQDWRDLPIELLPPGMQRAKRKDHTRRYSRMTWDGVPRSIITRFRDPKSGEYTHPEEHRTISIREAARIQSFPDHFVFCGSNTEQYDQVGNAVPPRLAEAVGKEIAACLRGEATHRLENPFSRRRTISQAQLSLVLP